jgi:citrate lyase subunit beta/citryl-CoA lyase
VVGGRPDVLLLPKADSARDLEALDQCLLALEAREGLPSGGIRVVVVATETGASVFNLGSYSPATPRLLGITWGAEDLATAVGARSNSDETGKLTPLFILARSLCLAAAGAAEALAIDTASMTIKDTDAVRADCMAARRDGFRAKLAIHPAQVPVINDVFTPTPAEIEEARHIVALFAANPSKGAFDLNGRMVDIPHLKQARQLLDSLAVQAS